MHQGGILQFKKAAALVGASTLFGIAAVAIVPAANAAATSGCSVWAGDPWESNGVSGRSGQTGCYVRLTGQLKKQNPLIDITEDKEVVNANSSGNATAYLHSGCDGASYYYTQADTDRGNAESAKIWLC